MNVKVELIISVEASPENVEEWIKFNFGLGGISDANPLQDHPIQPSFIQIGFPDQQARTLQIYSYTNSLKLGYR